MKNLLTLLLILISINSIAQFRSLEKRNHNVNKLLKEIKAYKEFKTAGFSFYAVDIHTGQTIAKLNPDMALTPASSQKLFTTATALELLGPDYRFETVLEYTGEIDEENKILQGDIIIKGGGDPTLGSKYFDETKSKQFLSEWAEAVKKLGIDSITGRVIADASVFSWDVVPPTWSWQNMGNYYGAGASGLSVYDNYYSIYFNTGSAGDTAEIVRLTPEIHEMVFDNSVTADSISYDNAYIFGAPYSNSRYIRGQLPINRNNFRVKGSMPDPALIAALQLDSVLAANGIGINHSPSTVRLLGEEGLGNPGHSTAFHSIYSPELSKIIAETNIHSINLYAEHCLLGSGIEMGARAETVEAVDSLISFWDKHGMDTQGLSLHDGSGLSKYNAITPRQMVHMLTYMKSESQNFNTFYNSMAIAGETGTLKGMFKGSSAYGKLRAKSGTVSSVKAYAGYVTSKSGREIAFSMVVNNFSCKSREARAKLEQLMIALSDFRK